jgi:hypothetical protein
MLLTMVLASATSIKKNSAFFPTDGSGAIYFVSGCCTKCIVASP